MIVVSPVWVTPEHQLLLADANSVEPNNILFDGVMEETRETTIDLSADLLVQPPLTHDTTWTAPNVESLALLANDQEYDGDAKEHAVRNAALLLDLAESSSGLEPEAEEIIEETEDPREPANSAQENVEDGGLSSRHADAEKSADCEPSAAPQQVIQNAQSATMPDQTQEPIPAVECSTSNNERAEEIQCAEEPTQLTEIDESANQEAVS